MSSLKRASFENGGNPSSKKRRKKFESGAPGGAGCSVFVGNLKYETKWQLLKDHMRKAGNVDSANILKNNGTGRSKGCALVTYQNPKEAQRAIRELNESHLEGRTIFVQADNNQSRDPNSNDNYQGGEDSRQRSSSGGGGSSSSPQGIYVGNLPFETSWQDLKDLFKSCGTIDRADVMEDAATGRKKGFGVVTFTNDRAVDNAIRKFHGANYEGRVLEVRLDKRSAAAGVTVTNNNNSNEGSDDKHCVFVGNLDYECSWQDLKDYVQQRCGRVEHADIPKRGFGILSFASRRDGASAISQLDGSVFQSRTLEARWDNAPNDSADKHQLYVGNLPFECAWQNLKDAFKRFGNVSRAEVCETNNGKSTGFGIVLFSHAESASNAMSAMDGTEFQGRVISVRWDRLPNKLATDKSRNRDNHVKYKDRTATTTSPKHKKDQVKGDALNNALSCPR